MKNEKIKKNSIVQVNELAEDGWVGCLIQVDEVKSWGIVGWVEVPKTGRAYIRLHFDKVDYIGEATMQDKDL